MGAPDVQHRGDEWDRKCHRLCCTYVHYTSKKSTRTREAKKVHHLLALQSARAAPCLVYPFPGLSFQGYERESGTRYRRFMPPVAAASALKGLRGGAPGGGWPRRSSAGTPGRAAPLRIALEQHPPLASFGASM